MSSLLRLTQLSRPSSLDVVGTKIRDFTLKRGKVQYFTFLSDEPESGKFYANGYSLNSTNMKKITIF
jgi:hypothetical protein